MKNRKLFIIFTILLLAVATTFCGFVVAKYIREKQTDVVVTSKNFFFTVDLLGDTINDEDLSKDYVLAGGDSKEITFYIQNYFDDYRICDTDVKYEVTMNITSTNSSYDSNLIVLSNQVDVEHVLNKNTKDFDKWVLSIPEGYENNTKIEIVIKSSYPYEKEMKLEFSCMTYDKEYSYEVIDDVNSPVAKLIIKTNVDIPAKALTVDFSNINSTSNVLQIDVTNPYIVDLVNGIPTLNTNKLPDGQTYYKSIVNTIKISAGEAIEIIFYKTDLTKNYSFDTISLDSVDGKFIVTI